MLTIKRVKAVTPPMTPPTMAGVVNLCEIGEDDEIVETDGKDEGADLVGEPKSGLLKGMSSKGVLTIVGAYFNVIVVKAPVGKDVVLRGESERREMDDRCKTYTPRKAEISGAEGFAG